MNAVSEQDVIAGSPAKVWTVWADYSATGEGRTLMARIAHATCQDAAIAAFARSFGTYFAQDAQAVEGVEPNGVTALMFSAAMLDDARRLAGKHCFVMEAKYHFNLS